MVSSTSGCASLRSGDRVNPPRIMENMLAPKPQNQNNQSLGYRSQPDFMILFKLLFSNISDESMRPVLLIVAHQKVTKSLDLERFLPGTDSIRGFLGHHFWERLAATK